MIFLIIINCLLLSFLSLLHFYWAMGGKWGKHVAIPLTRNGRKAFHPGITITLIVACGLLLFALITLANTGVFNTLVPGNLIDDGDWAIGIIFLLRTIGDFRYFGVTKRVLHTEFALYDNRIYIPLSLSIAIISFVLAILN